MSLDDWISDFSSLLDDLDLGSQDFDGVVTGSGSGAASVISLGNSRGDPSAPPGRVTVEGNAGDNWLSGGAGDDVIAGRAGDDTISGGAGADTFIYRLGDGNDVLTDFDMSVDRLLIYGTSSFTLVDDGQSTVITLSDGAEITLPAGSSSSSDLIIMG